MDNSNSRFKKVNTSTCVICGKAFIPYRPQQQCCSDACRHKLNIKYREEHKTPIVQKTCPICGTVFETSNPRKRHCSPECYEAYREKHRNYYKGKKETRICAFCGKEFETAHFIKRYCSHECYEASRRKRAVAMREEVLQERALEELKKMQDN